MSAAPRNAERHDAAADTAALYRRYERPLHAWLGRTVTAPPTLVEDACSGAWLLFVARQPSCDGRAFGWLCITALREAYRLLRLEKRERAAELGAGQQPWLVPPGRDDPETALEARRALVALASLRERERRYMAWQVGGYAYREMQELAGGATYTHVNKYLVRAHARLRELADEADERAAPSRSRGEG